MTINRDQIVVVDIECTCWENNRTPPGQKSEIIEVGVCLFNPSDSSISDKRSIFVRPIWSKVSPFCTQLTTLTQEQVIIGISLQEACDILETEYDTSNRLWGSWGNYDRRMFEEQCAAMGVRYPFSDRHVNLKNLFAKCNGGKRVGMAWALRIADLELVGTHHRGDDDAWNIARLLGYMLQKDDIGILKKYW